MKKFSSVLLTLALLFTMIPAFAVGATAATPSTGHIEIAADAETIDVGGETYTVLRTVDDLPKLATVGGRFILANDIDFGGADPGLHNLQNVIFDGNGYSYLNFKLEGTGSKGLFAIYNDQETVIRNINFGSPTQKVIVTINNTSAPTGNVGVGMLLSYTNSKFRFENINVYADMTAAERICMGGFVGKVGGGTATLVNCNFYGSITGNATADADVGYGGLVGMIGTHATFTLEGCNNYGNITTNGSGSKHKTAGLIAIFQAPVLTLKNCANYGDITTTSGGSVGGFISEFYLGKMENCGIKLEDCANYGKITGLGKTGGFVGFLNPNTNGVGGTILFEGCKNYGAMVGTGGDSGGFCGSISAKANIQVLNCANYGDLSGGGNNKAGVCGSISMQTNYTLTVTDFLNTGNITSGSRASGVSGWLAAGTYTFTRCINLGKLSGKGNSGGIAAEAVSGTTITDCLSAGKVTVSNTYHCGVIIGNAANAKGSGNFYMDCGSANQSGSANTNLGTELATWEYVVNKLNETYSNVWGSFMLNTAGDGVVPATPKLSAVQETAPADGTFNVRLIASLMDTVRYDAVGFKIQVNDSTEVNTISCKHVYTKLLATSDGVQTEVTATSLGGKYVYALAIKGIPATGTVTLKVTPYANDLNHTADHELVYTGETYVITYVDGVYQSGKPAQS